MFNGHPDPSGLSPLGRSLDPERSEGEREGSRFFAEFTLSEILRSLCSLRMTRSEGLRMTREINR